MTNSSHTLTDAQRVARHNRMVAYTNLSAAGNAAPRPRGEEAHMVYDAAVVQPLRDALAAAITAEQATGLDW